MTEAADLPSAVLRRSALRAKKSLGQNFLQDRAILTRIAECLDPDPGDVVLEIGSGTGALTEIVARRVDRVVAVELDASLAAVLRESTRGDNVEVVEADALRIDPCTLMPARYKLVGNIPYYVTGAILRRYLDSPCRPALMVLMVQREVAERLVAPAGHASLLSVSVQYRAEPRIIFRVPAGAFFPRPKVDSAVVRLTVRDEQPDAREAAAFFRVARAGFSMKRKQLVNSLRDGLELSRSGVDRLLSDAGIDPHRRPETLTVEEWKRLGAAFRPLDVRP